MEIMNPFSSEVIANLGFIIIYMKLWTSETPKDMQRDHCTIVFSQSRDLIILNPTTHQLAVAHGSAHHDKITYPNKQQTN
jgi:hypothetical protein